MNSQWAIQIAQILEKKMVSTITLPSYSHIKHIALSWVRHHIQVLHNERNKKGKHFYTIL